MGRKTFFVSVWLEEGEGKKLMGFRCFLFRPTKMFFVQNGETTEWEESDRYMTKMPMCTCTWACPIRWFFYLLFFLLLLLFCFLLWFFFLFFLWMWFFFSRYDFYFLINLGDCFCCHFFFFFCFNRASLFNKGIWVKFI